MKYVIVSGQKPMDISLELFSEKPNNQIKTIVYDQQTKDVILERLDILSGSKRVILKLPYTPKKIVIDSFTQQSRKTGRDNSFSVSRPVIMPLKKYNVDLGTGDREFLEFAKKFAINLPKLSADGRVRRSPSGKFKIVLMDKLYSYGGQYIPSPAMIGKKTGTIEISKDYFMKLSQSQRMATLCHEYGHFYKNPLINVDIGNEVGADLNGMSVFLAYGYGLSEYLNAFKKVFKGAVTDQNRDRYSKMKSFARRIYNGQYFGKPYNL